MTKRVRFDVRVYSDTGSLVGETTLDSKIDTADGKPITTTPQAQWYADTYLVRPWQYAIVNKR